MRLSKHKRKTLPEMNMTPMIDIVFLLIIFFMTISQVSEINKERLDLARQKGSEEQRESSIIINVTQAGDVVVSGNTVSMKKLVMMIDDQLKRVENDPTRLKVVLRVDRRGTCETANQIVKRLRRFEMAKVNFAVQVPEG